MGEDSLSMNLMLFNVHLHMHIYIGLISFSYYKDVYSAGDLLKLLDVSSAEYFLPTTYGKLQPPLGKHRLKVNKLIGPIAFDYLIMLATGGLVLNIFWHNTSIIYIFIIHDFISVLYCSTSLLLT
jgi:hypothetical protein